jgi:hypothetical protein
VAWVPVAEVMKQAVNYRLCTWDGKPQIDPLHPCPPSHEKLPVSLEERESDSNFDQKAGTRMCHVEYIFNGVRGRVSYPVYVVDSI